ncbi:MAG: 8-amino-7-oxononanoate synthase [Chitinophagaceae bacterium]|nr:8-amino-7-oxononanoate synthase [Chitinophagaceae bacterium]
MPSDDFLLNKLLQRKENDSFRELRTGRELIDFCSNDYLGIVQNNLLANNEEVHGSTGSRLLSGNYPLICEAETRIANFHQAKAALIFNSGYDANTGILSCVPQKGDTIIYDALSHASIRDGIRLSFAQSYSFAHNNTEDLKKKLQHASGNIFIVTESVFSMDGDFCPLKEWVEVAKQFDAHLIIDEAHATGIVGEKGEGLVQSLRLQDEIFCRIHTFGKACGCHGAVILGSTTLKDYLINFSRSFIYTTALPPVAVHSIIKSYEIFPGMKKQREHLKQLIRIFNDAELHFEKLASLTPVQSVLISGNENVKRKAAELQQEGFDVRPILYPTVPKEKERLRIVLHAFNTEDQLRSLLSRL